MYMSTYPTCTHMFSITHVMLSNVCVSSNTCVFEDILCWVTCDMHWVTCTPRHIMLSNACTPLRKTVQDMCPRHMSNMHVGMHMLDNVFMCIGHISWTEFICIGVHLQYMYWVYALECIYMYWTTMSRIVVR